MWQQKRSIVEAMFKRDTSGDPLASHEAFDSYLIAATVTWRARRKAQNSALVREDVRIILKDGPVKLHWERVRMCVERMLRVGDGLGEGYALGTGEEVRRRED